MNLDSVSAHSAETDAGRRVLVAMSGGVDSTVAAARLVADGFEVAGVTFRLFCHGENEAGPRACCGLEGMRDARAVALGLGISHTVLDLEELFQARVVSDFVTEYAAGRTPNPCVECNTHIKFGPLLAWAERQGYGWIATGHYARRVTVAGLGGRTEARLARAAHVTKDQSYVLWGVDSRVLERTLLPLGSLSKEEVRAEARRLGLATWDKAESQDICFVPDGDYAGWLAERLGPHHPAFAPGEIRDVKDRLLGRHEGLARYTVGQRRGLNLGGPKSWRVLALETAANVLRVGPDDQLDAGGLWAGGLVLHATPAEIAAEPVEVQIRYRHAGVSGWARVDGDRLHASFAEPQRAVAPGQSCVIYRDGVLLAGGRIEAACACCPPAGAAVQADA